MSTASPPAATSNPCPLASEPQHRGRPEHPSGFYALCAVELFERFAGTLLGSLLLLYLNERLGMAAGSATRLGGIFNAAIYLSSVIGGVIADRWLGTRWAMLLGTLLLALGYTVLSMDRATLLYPAAGLLMVGHALFKPSISSAVGVLCLGIPFRHRACWAYQDFSCSESSRCSVVRCRRNPVEAIVRHRSCGLASVCCSESSPT